MDGLPVDGILRELTCVVEGIVMALEAEARSLGLA